MSVFPTSDEGSTTAISMALELHAEQRKTRRSRVGGLALPLYDVALPVQHPAGRTWFRARKLGTLARRPRRLLGLHH